MDTDLFLIVGIFVCLFAVPGVIAAIVESRAPRAASIAILVGGGLMVLAITNQPGGYRFEDVPDVFFNVIARFMP